MKKKVIFSLLVILFCLTMFGLFINKNRCIDDSMYETVEIISPVSTALGEYKSNNGYYPADLQSLVSLYIDQIPKKDTTTDFDMIEYAPQWNRESLGMYGKPFIGENKPEFLFGVWRSGGLSTDTYIRYCPEDRDCQYQTQVSKNRDGKVVLEKEVKEPKRLNGDWVVLCGA